MATNMSGHQGGAMFNSAKCSVSKETQELLNLMMQESKLTNFQRKQLNSRLKEGKSLPVNCGPTSSHQKRTVSHTPTTPPKALNGRNFGLSSGKRRKETIEVLCESNKRDSYRPTPSKFISAKDKEKLQYKMAYGEEFVVDNDIRQTMKIDPTSNLNNNKEIDEFDEVLQEIEERRAFLQEMEELGEGKKYRPKIHTEISQKIRQLELIDKKRSNELEKALKEKHSKR